MNSTKYIPIDDIPIILHTIDSYSQYWDYWFYFTTKYIKHKNIIFASEQKEPSFKKYIQTFKTGYGQWGERLLNILSKVDSKYIFYMQEDFWAINNFPYTQNIINRVIDEDIDCWRICENSKLYMVRKIDHIAFQFLQNSTYTISHQFSLWKKDILAKYILPEENPWQNELCGSKRINASYHHKIYFQPNKWYVPAVRSGKLSEDGENMIQKEKLCQSGI